MVQIQRILCPVDFSDTSRRALEHAVAIAQWYESAIIALHVIHLPLFPTPPILFAEAASRVPVSESERRRREQEVREWLEPACRAGVPTNVIVDEGNAAARILDHATLSNADLIAMGTHGLAGIERFMLGSVAENVLRKAGCGVMTVPPAAHSAAKVPYRRILCPVDFSESSLAALQHAFSLAAESDAELTILHVFEWPPAAEMAGQPFDVPEYRRLIEQEACGRLDALVNEEAAARCKPSRQTAYGKPSREILRVAETVEADLIVIGVRGRNPVDVTIFGSTTNQVVRRASCPVLTLKQ